jgi:hypothetical protein
MQAMTTEEELKSAANELEVRQRELSTAEHYFITARRRYDELSRKWFNERFAKGTG